MGWGPGRPPPRPPAPAPPRPPSPPDPPDNGPGGAVAALQSQAQCQNNFMFTKNSNRLYFSEDG